jgi:hypothetical protein
VAEEHRRRGIARFIIAKRFEHVRGQTGVVSAAVPALSRQNNLESYYESLGFAPDPTEKNALVWHRPKIISTGLSTQLNNGSFVGAEFEDMAAGQAG